MANSRIPGPLGAKPSRQSDWDAPHQLGPYDQISSLVSHAIRDTPGPLGFMDWGDPSLRTSRKSGAFMNVPETGTITKAQLKQIFPLAHEQKLSDIAAELNVDQLKCGLGTCFQKAHFFAQIREECGSSLKVKSEDLSYSPEQLKKTFSYYARRADEAAMDGYLKNGKSEDGKTKAVQHANTELIANNVYAHGNGNGDAKSGDGWNYRGRGLIQITGRANYAACSKKYRLLYPGGVEDFEKNPELLEQLIFGVRSAVAAKKSTELPRSLISGRKVTPKEGLISRWHTMRSNKFGTAACMLSGLCLAPMAIGADTATISHCTAQEKVFFSCQVGKKIVSLCALKNLGEIEKLSYRYGVLGKIENEYVASVHNQHRFFGDVKPAAPQATVDQAWFISGDTRYLLTTCTGGDCSHAAGLTVFRRERILSNTRCAETRNSQQSFDPEVVDFGSNFEKSKSNTKLLILIEDDNSLEKIYPPRMQDSPP